MFELFTKTLFSFFCHQLPGILLIKESHTIFLCPRCIGLHAGFTVTFIVSCLLSTKFRFRLSRPLLIYISCGIIIMLMDWAGGYFDISKPTEFSRLISGSFCGISLGIMAFFYNRYLFNSENKRSTKVQTMHHLLILITLIPLPLLFVTFLSWYLLDFLLSMVILSNLFIIALHIYHLINFKLFTKEVL